MNVNELRLGNWVEHNSEWCYRGEEVIEFQWDYSDWYAIAESRMLVENIEPIELTEDWLVKFGFNKADLYNSNGYIRKKYSKFTLSVARDGYHYHNGFSENSMRIKYVHQLQNLYFALTSEELTLKP